MPTTAELEDDFITTNPFNPAWDANYAQHIRTEGTNPNYLLTLFKKGSLTEPAFDPIRVYLFPFITDNCPKAFMACLEMISLPKLQELPSFKKLTEKTAALSGQEWQPVFALLNPSKKLKKASVFTGPQETASLKKSDETPQSIDRSLEKMNDLIKTYFLSRPKKGAYYWFSKIFSFFSSRAKRVDATSRLEAALTELNNSEVASLEPAINTYLTAITTSRHFWQKAGKSGLSEELVKKCNEIKISLKA